MLNVTYMLLRHILRHWTQEHWITGMAKACFRLPARRDRHALAHREAMESSI
jgi:hypothetical protein